MPELPEVETTRRGLAPVLAGSRIERVVVRERRLRWPVPRNLDATLRNHTIRAVNRRAKYLLIETQQTTLILHLGMSGSLRIATTTEPLAAHDHLDLVLHDGRLLRFNDPRRFGSVHLHNTPLSHPLLRHLGPEPFEDDFNADYLAAISKGRRIAIKQHLMNARIVVGVGNIYASEALFRAGVHPTRAAGRIGRGRFEPLVQAVRDVLQQAIDEGGTTLRDFTAIDGRPGYFQQSLQVYGRDGHPCNRCGSLIRVRRQGQRATYYCPRCQR